MTNNAVKITYIVSQVVSGTLCLCLAVAAPIWLTPGLYWWTVFGLVMWFACSKGFTERLNSWGDCGRVE